MRMFSYTLSCNLFCWDKKHGFKILCYASKNIMFAMHNK